MTTLIQFVERIRRILVEGDPSINDRIQDPELRSAVAASCAYNLKIGSLATHYTAEGGSIPDAAMIATYENLPVMRGNGGNSRVTLPAQPMANMPERMGIFSVYPSGLPDEEYIPLPPGINGRLRKSRMYNDLNATTYTAEARYVDIHADLIGAGIDRVDMKLVVVDPSTLGDYDPLPIGPDQEIEIMKDVVRLYGGVWPEDTKND